MNGNVVHTVTRAEHGNLSVDINHIVTSANVFNIRLVAYGSAAFNSPTRVITLQAPAGGSGQGSSGQAPTGGGQHTTTPTGSGTRTYTFFGFFSLDQLPAGFPLTPEIQAQINRHNAELMMDKKNYLAFRAAGMKGPWKHLWIHQPLVLSYTPVPPAFAWPIPSIYEIASPFGWRNFDGGGYHRGIDVPAPVGTTVVAMGDGEIVDNVTWGGGGRTLVVRHSRGYRTIYMHLQSHEGMYVGEDVYQGEEIAKSGRSVAAYRGAVARDTGTPHLHFEILNTIIPPDPRQRVTINPLECYHPDDDRGRAFRRIVLADGRIRFILEPAATPADGASRGNNNNPAFVLRDGQFVPNPDFRWSR